jgi:hypothetical protein
MLAGIAWLITGGLTAYLAYQQLQAYQLLQSFGAATGDLGTYAIVNGVSAAVTFWFGARLLTKPSRSLHGWSIVWAIISVTGGVLQLAQGIGNDVFALSIITSAAAGVISAAARSDMPAPARTPVTFRHQPAPVYTNDMAGEEKLCGRCHEKLVPTWTRCRHCGAEFKKFPPVSPLTQTVTATPPATPAAIASWASTPAALTQPTASATPARQMGTAVSPTSIVPEEPTFATAVSTTVPVEPPTPVVREQLPRPTASPAPTVALPAADTVATAAKSRASGRAIGALVVAISLVAIGLFGGVVLLNTGRDPLAAATPTPTMTPAPTPIAATPVPFNGTGAMTFGKTYNADTLEIVGPATKFKSTTNPIAWVAALKGPAGSTDLTFVMASKGASGNETFVYTEPFTISDPTQTPSRRHRTWPVPPGTSQEPTWCASCAGRMSSQKER